MVTVAFGLCLISIQLPSVTSPPAPSLESFLRTLPPELGFVRKWKYDKTAELQCSWKRSEDDSLHEAKYYQFEFVTERFPVKDKLVPQKWAGVLKRELTRDKGWKLYFPAEGSFDATAEHRSKSGSLDLWVDFINRYGRCYLQIHDKSKPISYRKGNLSEKRRT